MSFAKWRSFRAKLDGLIGELDDEAALENTVLFPAWKSGTAYTAGDRVQYEELLYKCVQGHTAQEDWTPDATPALWTEISLEEWPEWRQPSGAQDAYNAGDKVSHSGAHWVSTVDSNVWEPGVYGWEEVTD